MSFLSAAFLWALPLAAAPVVIHLLHRRQQTVIRWGAMQFLVDATRRRRNIWRLEDWLVMALRTAAIAAIVFAAARPLVRASWVGVGPQRDVLFVLDVSMSMNRQTGEESPFKRLQERLASALQQVSGHDSVQVVLAASAPVWLTAEPVPGDSAAFSTLQQQLTKLEPSLGPGDLMAAIEQALAAETSPGAQSRLIVVISDVRGKGMPADGAIAASRLQQLLDAATVPTAINVLDVGESGETIANIGLDALEANRVLAGIGEQIEFRARVQNYGTARVESFPLAWTIDGESIHVTFTEPLDPGQTTEVTVEHAFDQPGIYELACRADLADELAGDNDARLILEVRAKAPILVVTSSAPADPAGEDVRYVLAALGVGPAANQPPAFFEPKLVDLADLERTSLSDALAIVLVDAAPLSDTLAERLIHFVSRGGGVWLALGTNTDAQAFNRVLAQAGGLSPVEIGAAIGDDRQDTDFAMLHPPAKSHPATALLGDTARLDIQDGRLFRRWQLKPRHAEDKLSVLLETGRGEPVAVEQFLGRGRVIVQGIPLTRAWSNLTLCQLFVPYVQEWLRYLVQPAAGSRNLAIHQALILKRPEDAPDLQATLHAPLQEPIPLVANVEQDELAYRFLETVFPGDYTLDWGGDQRPDRFYVRRDPAESNLQPWPREQRSAFDGLAAVRFGTDPLDWPAGVPVAPKQTPIWNGLLFALGALVAVELIVLAWCAWRKHVVGRLPAATAAVGSSA